MRLQLKLRQHLTKCMSILNKKQFLNCIIDSKAMVVYKCHNEISLYIFKSRIRETLNLLTDADSSTDTLFFLAVQTKKGGPLIAPQMHT